MLLSEWVERYNRERGRESGRGGKRQGALTYLVHETKLTLVTIKRVVEGHRPGMKAAIKIRDATAGEVTLEDLAALPGPEDEPAEHEAAE